jgi:molecular chaperone HscB
MPAQFLMQQMEWREALDEVGDARRARKLQAEVEAGPAHARCRRSTG